jgi:hypothetical protein
MDVVNPIHKIYGYNDCFFSSYPQFLAHLQ